DTNRRVRDLEAGSPIGFSSVERGGLRIASDQGLLIEGQGLVTGLFDVTGTLSGSGTLDWSGTSKFTGQTNVVGPLDVSGLSDFTGNMGISGDMDVSGDADFTGAVHARSFVVEGSDSYVQMGESGFALMNGSLSGGGATFAITLNKNGVSFNEGTIKMGALELAASANNYHVLVLNEADNKVYLGPTVGGIGTGPGPINPGDPEATGLITPFPWSTVTSEFGPRESPGGIGSTDHLGIDYGWYPAVNGAPIPASGAGTVDFAGWAGGYGNAVQIDHGDGIKTYYAHQSSIIVSAGQTVNQGQTIGYIGSTGNSTGPHLHLEIIVDGVERNPRNYLV
uniref:M23 family metallopeptidase n=1 Tax=Gulosibacter molinativorax TaxID=256821 RepID=UPI0012EC1CC1